MGTYKKFDGKPQEGNKGPKARPNKFKASKSPWDSRGHQNKPKEAPQIQKRNKDKYNNNNKKTFQNQEEGAEKVEKKPKKVIDQRPFIKVNDGGVKRKFDEDEDTNEGKDEADQDNTEQAEDGEDNGDGTDKSKKQQKKAKVESLRKFKKKNPEVRTTIEEAKRIWEKARVHDLSEEEKKPRLAELYELVKGRTVALVFKHDASRIIQTLLKSGDEEMKENVAKDLKGHMVELTMSHFGHFLARKVLRYASKPTRRKLLEEFKGHYPKLLKHKESSEIVEWIYSDILKNEAERLPILHEFYGTEVELKLFQMPQKANLAEIIKANPTKKTKILQTLGGHVEKLFEKGVPVIHGSIVHRLGYEYLSHATDPQILELIDTLCPLVPELVHTKEGSLVAVKCVSYASPKQRKIIVKAFRTYVLKACKAEYGHRVIIRILDAVDDTTLVSKNIINEMMGDIDGLMFDNFGYLTLLAILAPHNPAYFPQLLMSLLEPTTITTAEGKTEVTSKKSLEVRQKELLPAVLDKLEAYCMKNVTKVITTKHSASVLYELLHNLKDPMPLLKKLSDAATGKAEGEILDGYVSSRILKNLIASPRVGEEFAKILCNDVSNKL
eukprot:TRINITY_DN2749_c0_g1_i2.p1 TRINITY_DN2749_c0_g1~~TRINITY_DN2749_c0_g1_i2.p1  ORF type:complete len:610 (-),score=205.16 TRINITY_DN2749_c0_g1_i2:117-1946(-)